MSKMAPRNISTLVLLPTIQARNSLGTFLLFFLMVYFCSIKVIAPTMFLPFCVRGCWWKYCGAPVLLHWVGGHRSQGEAKKARIPRFPLPLFTRLRCSLHVLYILIHPAALQPTMCHPYKTVLQPCTANLTFLCCSTLFTPWVARHRRHKRVPASDLTIQSGPAGTWQ